MWKYIGLFIVCFYACGNGTTASETKTLTQTTENKDSNEDKNRKSVKAPEDGFDIMSKGPAKIVIQLTDTYTGPVRLVSPYGDQNVEIDNYTVTSGNKIIFEKEEGYPQGMYFFVFPDNKFIQAFLGDDQQFEMTCSIANSMTDMIVKGSEENTLFYATLRFEADHRAKVAPVNAMLQGADKSSGKYKANEALRDKIIAERTSYLDNLYEKHPNTLFAKFKKAGQNPTLREDVAEDDKVYYYRKDFWESVDFSDKRLMRTPVIRNKLNRYITDLTGQNPDSIKSSVDLLMDRVLDYPVYYQFLANWVVFKYEPTKSTLMDSEAVFVHMIQNYFTYDRAFWNDSTEVYGLQLRAHEMAQSLVGLQGPDITSYGSDGKDKTLYDLTADYLVVYLFNPDCEHCKIESPQLVKMWNETSRKEFDVYAIALDTDDTQWKNYISSMNMKWTNVHDPTNKTIYGKYFVNITPEIYVLNKERTIIGKNLKVSQIKEIIDRDKAKG